MPVTERDVLPNALLMCGDFKRAPLVLKDYDSVPSGSLVRPHPWSHGLFTLDLAAWASVTCRAEVKTMERVLTINVPGGSSAT